MGSRAGMQAGRWMAILDRLAATKGGVTIAELARDFNCTPRTIYRDLVALQEQLGAAVVCDRDEGEPSNVSSRWKLMDGKRYRSSLEFTPSELLAILAAEGLMAPLSGTPYGAGMKTLRAKLRARLPDDTVKFVAQDAAALAIGVAARPDYGPQARVVEVVRQAIRENRTIEMRYFSLSGGRETVRRLDPYRLWFARETLYVVGGCHVHGGAIRTFAIDRIRAIEPTSERFVIPATFRWEDWARDSFRIFQDGEPARVVIHFSAAIAPLIRERVWHPSQQLIELPGGDVGIAMRVSGLFEVTQWILGFGADAKPVSPPELVTAVTAEVKKMYAALVDKAAPAVDFAPGRTGQVRRSASRMARRATGKRGAVGGGGGEEEEG